MNSTLGRSVAWAAEPNPTIAIGETTASTPATERIIRDAPTSETREIQDGVRVATRPLSAAVLALLYEVGNGLATGEESGPSPVWCTVVGGIGDGAENGLTALSHPISPSTKRNPRLFEAREARIPPGFSEPSRWFTLRDPSPPGGLR